MHSVTCFGGPPKDPALVDDTVARPLAPAWGTRIPGEQAEPVALLSLPEHPRCEGICSWDMESWPRKAREGRSLGCAFCSGVLQQCSSECGGRHHGDESSVTWGQSWPMPRWPLRTALGGFPSAPPLPRPLFAGLQSPSLGVLLRTQA